MDWYLKCIKNYAVFSGRARRREYWIFTLFNIIVVFLLIVVIPVILMETNIRELVLIPLTLYYIFLLGTLLPSLAVTVRRLHDIGISGWWMFLIFIPIGGVIAFLVFTLLDSQEGSNKYGKDPKGL